MAPYKPQLNPGKPKPKDEPRMPTYTEITACRACGSSELADVFLLGEMCINAFPAPDEPDPPKVPLTLCLCAGCSLLQLRHTVNSDLLFKKFFYRTSTTATMRAAMKDIVTCASKHVDVGKGDFVVDIGANDGTLLRCWPEDTIRIGFEPAENLRTCAKNGGNIIISDYFTARYLRGYAKKPKVITAAAMLYDVSNLQEFLSDVWESLADDGIFVCQ